MRIYHKIAGPLLVIFFIICATAGGYSKGDSKEALVTIHDKAYTFEVAKTQTEKQEGLMFRKFLNNDSGMLFVYDSPGYLRFYMKNTFIPLDIAFIDVAFRVVDIQNMNPMDENSVVSKKKAQYAIEVNRGFLKKARLKIGDKVDICYNTKK